MQLASLKHFYSTASKPDSLVLCIFPKGHCTQENEIITGIKCTYRDDHSLCCAHTSSNLLI